MVCAGDTVTSCPGEMFTPSQLARADRLMSAFGAKADMPLCSANVCL